MSEVIIEILNKKNGEKLDFKDIRFEKFDKYMKVFIDEKLIRRNNPYSVKYKCFNCNKINIVNLNIYANKLRRNQTKCSNCVEYIDDSVDMDSNYENEYFKIYPTDNEMKLYWNKIISFQNNKFTKLEEFEYIPALKKCNNNNFQPFFRDILRDVLERPVNIKFKCDICGGQFVVKDLSCIKNKLKIFCDKCSLSKKVSLKIHTIKNCVGEKINYFSKFQLRFIKFCNKNKIRVVNRESNYYLVDRGICLSLENKVESLKCVNPKNFSKFRKSILSK